MLGYFDRAVFHFINGALANPFFDMIMPVITSLGDGKTIFILALLLILILPKEKKVSGIYLLAGLTLTYYAVDYLKETIAMPRPFVALEDVRLIVPKARGYSFPSGHSATIFMAATIMTGFLKRGYVWFLIACFVGFSRMYVGVHYLSDVISGASLGIIIGYCLIAVTASPERG